MTTYPSLSGGVLTPRPIIIPAPSRAQTATDTDNLAAPPGPDWGRMKHALRRYKWFILLLTGACVALGVFATRVLRPEYTADTMFWIDAGGDRADQEGPVRPEQSFDAEAWTSLLRSYAVLEGVARDVRLYMKVDEPDAAQLRQRFELGPAFTPGEYRLQVADDGRSWTLARANGKSETGAVGDSVGRAFGFQWTPPASALYPGRDLRFTVQSPRMAAAALREDLDLRIDEEANFLSVELKGPDPEQLAATLNALGDRYVAQAAALKQQNVTAYSGILAEQVASARADLTAAEAALESFRIRTATIPGDMESVRGGPSSAGGVRQLAGEGPRGEVYYNLVAALEASRRERGELEGAVGNGSLQLSTIQRVAAGENSTELTEALAELTVKRNELRSLRYRYADAHPPIQRLLGEIATLENDVIPPLVAQTSARMRERESSLESRVNATVGTLRQVPSRDRELTRLQRNALLAEQLYASLQSRYDESRLAEESAVAEVRVLDKAIAPAWPTKNSQPAILLFSFFGGLALASGIAVALDKSDKRFRYPDQVTKDLGLTILGAVPHVKPGGNALVRQTTSTPFQEALRDIRLNLAYAHGTTGPLHLTITSPGSSDGKSFLSTHLARVFAEGGARTLLIDGDLRRGMLNERFNHPRRPGLSEYLRGAEPRERVIQKTVIDRLDLITSGSRQREAPEMLGGPLLSRLLADVRADYDVVICDSPPLSAGVDSVVLGAATENILLVVRTGVSQREVAAARLEVLGRMPVRVIGAVLNDVPRDNAYSYYSHYALPGYETRNEDELVTTPAR
jgi:tyrosine-protein kinase Etk/Wzc